MASKKIKSPPADDTLDELFSGIRDDAKAKKPPKPKPAAAAATTAARSSLGSPPTTDILADLESELAPQPPSSRPHTPRLSRDAIPRRSAAGTPPVAGDAAAAAAAAARKSTDSARSYRAAPLEPQQQQQQQKQGQQQQQQQEEEEKQQQQQSAGGGWWGGLLSTATATASAAMKQAEAAYIQIQQNEEAKKWADQVKDLGAIHVGALRIYGDELRSRALPTFTNILHTLAPPIHSHERLLIHISHDLIGYPSLDPLIHAVFARVMAQVEGGDLLVAQRGHEAASRRPLGPHDANPAGWRDGPWWRQVNLPRELNLVRGRLEGSKLCRANAEAHAAEHFAATGGIEAARRRAKEDLSESNPVRTSDLFLSVQAVTDSDGALFAQAEKSKDIDEGKNQEDDDDDNDNDDNDDELVCFAVFIRDPVHDIEFHTISQAVPSRWAHWLDAPSPLTPQSADELDADALAHFVPEDIRDIVDGGGVDPREWVAEWIEEALTLAVGVVAQKYVAKRMGVGERVPAAAVAAARLRQDVLLEENAGEAARGSV